MKTKFYTFSLLFLCMCIRAIGSMDTVKTGSYIINMGVIPQTIGNGLKPYGLVYDLLTNHRVSVKWVMNSAKTKDGVDFVHNGITYRGSAFIIDAEYRTAQLNAVIASWEAQGVVGHTTTSDFVIEVSKTLNYGPNWTMDKQNGHLAEVYFTNAGIPSTAYGGDSSNWKNPSELGACDDIFVLPHADPAWATHQNLYYWNLNYKGNIWVACHAASALENLESPDQSIRLNFLSTQGLVETSLHKKHSTPPFVYSNHGDFVMQFVGTLDNATTNGSERSFLPKIGSSWRSSTTLGVYDTVDTYIPSLSAGPAAVVAYGRAYGDTTRGWVMYEAGHTHNESGTGAEKIAAQRAFFNYSFFVAAERYANFTPSIAGIEAILTVGVPANLSLEVPAWVDLSKYTIEWSSTTGGTFTPADSQHVTYTPSLTTGRAIITVSLRDACDRTAFSSQMTFITGLLNTSILVTGKYIMQDKKVVLNWQRLNEPVSYFEVERRLGEGAFVKVGKVMSNNGPGHYQFEDSNPGTGTIQYRLVHKLTSGEFKYSNIVTVKAGGVIGSGVQTVVNPARGRIQFEYASTEAASVSVIVFDMHGKRIYVNKPSIQMGTNTLTVAMPGGLPAGVYVLQVSSKENTTAKRVYYLP